MIGLVSIGLRGLSLVGKLALSLYMAKFFTLDELGRYGLAFGAVMLATALFGFRLDYPLSREVLGLSPLQSRRVGTTVLWIFLISFVLAAPVAAWFLLTFDTLPTGLPFLVLVYLVCCVEAYANFLYTTTIALKRAMLANALFFVRSGLWTVPAMTLGYFIPAMRTVNFVLGWWLAGVSVSVALNLWFVRDRLFGWFAWRNLAWDTARSYVGRALLVWVGSIALTLGAYIDRFVLARYMTLADVGIATFYLSFSTSVLTLVQSATTSVTFPRLIEHYDRGDRDQYAKELRTTGLVAAALGGAVLVPLAAIMPFVARAVGKPALLASYVAFLLVLLATWLRINAETIYYALFVHRQHREIWLGNLLFLATAFGLNMLLIPRLGLTGLGLAATVAAAGLLGWRGYFALQHHQGQAPLPR